MMADTTDLSVTDLLTNLTTAPPSNASSGSGDPSWLLTLRIVCEVYLCMPISLLGIVGNILSFIVLCYHKQKLSTTVVLQGLAIIDTLVLITLFLLGSMRYVGWSEFMDIYHYLFRWLYPILYFLRLFSTWLTVLLTVDRFIAVCYPLHAQRLCHRHRTVALMAILLITAFAFSFIRYFEYTIVPHSVSPFRFKATSLPENKYYTMIYRIALFFIFMYLIPMAVLITLNTRLLCTLRKAHEYRAYLTQQSYKMEHIGLELNNGSTYTNGASLHLKNQNRSITMMVFAVVLVSILSNITAMVSHVLWSLPFCFSHMDDLVLPRRTMSHISNVLITINSASNFIIYCLCSRNFRSVFIRVFGCEHLHRQIQRGRRKSSDTEDKRRSLTGSSYISIKQMSTKYSNPKSVPV